jgi:hypothetical protein
MYNTTLDTDLIWTSDKMISLKKRLRIYSKNTDTKMRKNLPWAYLMDEWLAGITRYYRRTIT